MHISILSILSFVTFVTLTSVVVATEPEPPKSYRQPKKLFRKLKIPKGSSLSLTVQVSRPKILTRFVPDDDAIILDAVVELPMWLDMDRMADALYNVTREDEPTGPKFNDDEVFQYRGKERCYLYERLESLVSMVFLFAARRSHFCLLRAICEIHEISTFYFPEYCPSFAFEMIQLFLTPSLGGKDECHQDYNVAEVQGRAGMCYKFNTTCPINISGLIYTKLIPH